MNKNLLFFIRKIHKTLENPCHSLFFRLKLKENNKKRTLVLKDLSFNLKIKWAIKRYSPEHLSKLCSTPESCEVFFSEENTLLSDIVNEDVEKHRSHLLTCCLFEKFSIEQRKQFFEIITDEENKTLLEDMLADSYYLPITREFIKRDWIKLNQPYSCNFKGKQIQTNLFHIAIQHNNLPIIFEAMNENPQITCAKNSLGLLPFSVAVTYGLNETARNLAITYIEQTKFYDNSSEIKYQLDGCLYFLRERVNKKNSIFSEKKQVQINKICASLFEIARQFDVSLKDFLFNEKDSVIFNAISTGDLNFIEVCANNLFVDFSREIKGLSLIEWAAKFYQTGIIKFLNKRCKIVSAFHSSNKTQKNYTNFLDIPYFISFNQDDNLNAKKYLHFFLEMTEYLKIQHEETNDFGNTHLHNLCSSVSEANFKETLKIFKGLLKYINPELENLQGKKAVELIKDDLIRAQFEQILDIKQQRKMLENHEFTLLETSFIDLEKD